MNQISLPAPARQPLTRRSEVCDKPRSVRAGAVVFSLFACLAVALAPAVFAAPQTQPAGAANAARATNSLTRAGTNAAPETLSVPAYEITGNTLLSDNTLDAIASKHIGTNMMLAAARTNIDGMKIELQREYLARGYPTVEVVTPPQNPRTNNGIIQITIVEGKLADVLITGNKHFTSNNIMRALPSLHTNVYLNSYVFAAELDRANQNKDRQIYPKILPGPTPGTSTLLLRVEDRMPLHGKFELNDLSSPGTPDMRMDGSLAYNNLWQMEHSAGVQYSFSPQALKAADQWAFFDRPEVANYSGFYRMPLRDPEPVSEQVAKLPGSFGYNEATRKFSLPPPDNVPELNFYASRSTVDTGIDAGPVESVSTSTNFLASKQFVTEDWTLNEDLGFRFSQPVREFAGIASTFSAGLDFKTYHTVAFGTNNIITITLTQPPVTNNGAQAVPTTRAGVQYLPVAMRWDGSRMDKRGNWTFGFGYNGNFSSGLFNDHGDFRAVTGSSHGNGDYQVFNGSVGREIILNTETNSSQEWRLALRAEGQWANQPLIPTEQFGNGGIDSIRGYHEGEVFGDTGWRVMSELKTRLYTTYVDGKTPTPVQVRASVFMDYGETYLLDPLGRRAASELWGTGFGLSGTIGPRVQARFLFGFPLINQIPSDTRSFLFNFVVSAEF